MDWLIDSRCSTYGAVLVNLDISPDCSDSIACVEIIVYSKEDVEVESERGINVQPPVPGPFLQKELKHENDKEDLDDILYTQMSNVSCEPTCLATLK